MLDVNISLSSTSSDSAPNWRRMAQSSIRSHGPHPKTIQGLRYEFQILSADAALLAQLGDVGGLVPKHKKNFVGMLS
jgi:hypothetical protein